MAAQVDTVGRWHRYRDLRTAESPRASPATLAREPVCVCVDGLWRHAKRNEHRARVLGKSEWVGGRRWHVRALKLLMSCDELRHVQPHHRQKDLDAGAPKRSVSEKSS